LRAFSISRLMSFDAAFSFLSGQNSVKIKSVQLILVTFFLLIAVNQYHTLTSKEEHQPS
jgi:lipoprotein signal peptidase